MVEKDGHGCFGGFDGFGGRKGAISGDGCYGGGDGTEICIWCFVLRDRMIEDETRNIH